jgi:hypothetical protein
MTSSSLFLNTLPHRCWNTWRNIRTVIEGTDTDSLHHLIVTHLVKNFAWILWNRNVHYHNCNSLLVIPIHSQPNQARTSRLYLSSTVYLMRIPESSKWHLLFRFFIANLISICRLSCAYYTSQPSCDRHDFRLPPWCKWYHCSSGILRSVEW